MANSINPPSPHRYLIFPLFSGTNPRARLNHWTLLTLDKQTNEWKFYNSYKPRTAGVEDVYEDDAKDMKKYVEKSAKKSCIRDIPLGLPLINVQDAPQQKDGRNDCGVIVLSIIREYFLHVPMEFNEIKEGVSYMRKTIVESLLNYKLD